MRVDVRGDRVNKDSVSEPRARLSRQRCRKRRRAPWREVGWNLSSEGTRKFGCALHDKPWEWLEGSILGAESPDQNHRATLSAGNTILANRMAPLFTSFGIPAFLARRPPREEEIQ